MRWIVLPAVVFGFLLTPIPALARHTVDCDPVSSGDHLVITIPPRVPHPVDDAFSAMASPKVILYVRVGTQHTDWYVYRESNGVPGLQRGDSFLVLEDPLWQQNCGHGPDELLFYPRVAGAALASLAPMGGPAPASLAPVEGPALLSLFHG